MIPFLITLISQNTRFKKKVSLEEMKAHKEDRVLRGRQIAYLIYEYFRVIGANDSVENYADLFTVFLRIDDVQDFGTRWDEILLSMTKIPPDDVLESLYKLRIRESDQLKNALELYDMGIQQKISMPNNQQMKTMVKRSTDQKVRLRNFDARNERIETGAVVTNRRKDSVREETSVGSGTMKISAQNRHQKPLHPLNRQHKEVEVHRGNRTSEARVHLGSSLDSRAEIT